MNFPGFSINRQISAPKHFTTGSLITFIKDCEEIFRLNSKHEKGFLLDLSKVQQASMLTILVIYKLIEYAFTNKCFERPAIKYDKPIQKDLIKYGFSDLILTYMADRKQVEAEYRNLKVSMSESFFIAPQALLRNDKFSVESLNKNYLPVIERYYQNSEKVISMIFLVFSEVLLNFWEHAVEDTKSIIVAHGNKQNIEIACADTGEGIVSTLGRILSSHSLSPTSVLEKAIQKGVTSKRLTNHMGYGLWILDEITTRTGGRMHIYSQGAYYYNEKGRKKLGKCGYWQGTIVYLSLPLLRPVTLSDIELGDRKNNHIIKINWA
jgi:hypothetical protein